jgi:hypothetical protein
MAVPQDLASQSQEKQHTREPTALWNNRIASRIESNESVLSQNVQL